ncbi:MAG: type II toxin-antitoxin system ParD family antitoxin [Proteobacteria bacterium]|nr:type II toxin-antitoxin system ParD family antitoxin [Pseudomonadota bacterium]
MTMVKKSITVTDQQEEWIQAQMATGNYGTDSELIREALREKQNRTSEIEAIQMRLIKAELSGFVKQNRNEILAEFKDELRNDGKL